MKTLTIINASPRKKGNTQKILDIFVNNFDGIIHIYNMYEDQPAPCKACNYCEANGKCFMNDMDKIIENVFSSDYIVFASPIYCYSFPAPMKAFLDRLQPYYSDEKYRNPTFTRKGFVLASCGKSGKFGVDVIEKQSRIAFIELAASFEGMYLFANTDSCDELTAGAEAEIRALSEKFFI